MPKQRDDEFNLHPKIVLGLFRFTAQPDIAVQREPAVEDCAALSLLRTKPQNYSQKWPKTTLVINPQNFSVKGVVISRSLMQYVLLLFLLTNCFLHHTNAWIYIHQLSQSKPMLTRK